MSDNTDYRLQNEVVTKEQFAPVRKEGYPTIDPGSDEIRAATGICPVCHATVVKQRNVCDTYYCGNCLAAFPAAEVIDARS